MAHPDDPRAPTPADPPAPSTTPNAAGPGLGGYLLTPLLALACGLGGAYLYMRFLADHGGARSALGRSAVADETEPAVGTPSRELSDRIDRLGERVDRLKRQLDDLPPKDKEPADVASLQVRVADLTDSTNNLAPLPGRVDALANRVSDLSVQVKSVRDEMSSAVTRGGRSPRLASTGPVPRDPPPADPVTTPAPIRDDRRGAPPARLLPPADQARDVGPALSRAAALFRRGQYKAARDVFSKLELSEPDDARIWYYAALSSGFATGDWTGGTVRLVEKGVAREEAGTPKTAEIDDEFKDLTTANGKDWLAAYRKRVNASR